MLRVAGVVLSAKKHLWVALCGIYGIGKTRALKVCELAGLSPETKVKDLNDDHGNMLQRAINDLAYEVEGELRRKIGMCIKRLVDIKCYRGIRHRRGLPVRGQRTRTNARTRKGGKSGGKGKKR